MKVLIIVHDGIAISDSQQLTVAKGIRKLTKCNVCQIDQMQFEAQSPVNKEDEQRKACKEAFKVIEFNFRDTIRKKNSLSLAVEIVKYTSKHKEDNPITVACDVICRAEKTHDFYILASEYGLNRDQISAIMSAIKD